MKALEKCYKNMTLKLVITIIDIFERVPNKFIVIL